MTTEALNIAFREFLIKNPKIIILLVWIIIIKAFALWYSARRNQKIWFAAILIVNTAGILEIAYLLYYYIKEKKERTQITPSL